MNYYFATTIEGPFDEAVARAVQALQDEGFGVLTEIDVSATLKKKIGADFRPYRILGACNPALAFEALQREDKIGTMLPCNVVVAQDGDGSRVDVFDPAVMTELGSSPALAEVAAEARLRLTGMMDALVHDEEVDDAARA